ncbi:hypothetical protein HanPSC8_Chr01g0005021 [Helianthus annuus]|nr:hypothetical protein HanPSC8_Chr01g0005021 [Helianthus annuus]
MLNDEVLRLEAQKGTQATVLAATSAQTPPQTNQPGHTSDTNSSSTRGRGRGRGSWNRRGGRGRGSNRQPYSPWAGQQQTQPTYPNWAWWTPPPCPYPTKQQWRPTNSPSQQPSASSQVHFSGFQQPHFSGFSPSPQGIYNALSPSDLSAAFTTMQMNPPASSWASDIMDTGAESHVTHDQGSQN